MSIYIFSQFWRFYFNTVEHILACGYFGKIRKNALSFKAHVSMKCIVKLSIRKYYPTPSTCTSSILIFFGSDGKLLEESTASICKGVAIKTVRAETLEPWSGSSWSGLRNWRPPLSVMCKWVISGHQGTPGVNPRTIF